MFTSGAFLIGIVTMIVSFAVSSRLKNKFKKYSKTPLASGLSGKEVAEMMLRDNNIYDVQVLSVPGKLTDHYNPMNKTVNLSPEVYSGRNAAAAAVAAHECGHAVQHATSYSMLNFRTALVPLQNASATILNVVVIASIFGGSFLFSAFPFEAVLFLVIGVYGIMTLFTLVTLPVEFDASNRALSWISERRIFERDEHAMAKDALWWAAMTYVVAALGSLATLLYYVSLLMSSRD
jgi:uncharacterized protein